MSRTSVARKQHQPSASPNPPTNRGSKKPPQSESDVTPPDKDLKLSVVPKTKSTAITKDEPAELLSESFKKRATQTHERILKIIERIDKDVVTLGDLCLQMKDKAFYRVIDNPATGTTYKTSIEYFGSVLPTTSKSQIFQSMRIVRELTSGDTPAVAADEVRGMSRENAEGLAKLHERHVPITPDLIEKAKTLPIQRFQDEIVIPLAPDIAARQAARRGVVSHAAEPQIMVRTTLEFPADLEALHQRALTIAMKICGDDDRTIPLKEKGYQAIFANFISEYEGEFEEAVRQDAEKARNTAEYVSASGPEGDDDDVVLDVEDPDEYEQLATERTVELDEDSQAAQE